MVVHSNVDYVLHLPYPSSLRASKNFECSPHYCRPHLTCYIPWGFTSYSEVSYYEDFCLYLGLEELRNDLEFLWTLVEYDGRGNVLIYNVKPMPIVEVTEDQGDHADMSSEEIEEYMELLW